MLTRKRKIWRAKRTRAALSSTGCSEQSSKKLREPCVAGCYWKERHINCRTLQRRSRTSPWTPTTVLWKRSLALSERHFAFLPASTGACLIRTFTCRRRIKFTFLPPVPHQPPVRHQKEKETWIYSIALQATTPGTRGVCWNTQVL